MTRTEHLLIILAEECVEVAQRCSKALRFGLNEVEPGQSDTNARRIEVEMHDILAVYGMLREVEALPITVGGAVLTEMKRQKVDKYLAHSRQCGTLDD
jgi:hypothetical protein